MTKIKVLIIIIFAFPKFYFAQSILKDTVVIKGLRHSDISIIQLLANPEKYNGFKVTVTGYIHIQFEDCAIYLTKSDADYLNGSNALWVHFKDKIEKITTSSGYKENSNISIQYFDCKYVRITGIFNMDDRGHLGAFAGSIDSIDNIIEERQWYDGNKELWEHQIDGKGLAPKK